MAHLVFNLSQQSKKITNLGLERVQIFCDTVHFGTNLRFIHQEAGFQNFDNALVDRFSEIAIPNNVISYQKLNMAIVQ